jgi:hypothetical protein
MVKRKRSYAGQSKRLPSSLLVHTEPAPQHSWLARTVPLPAALFLAAKRAAGSHRLMPLTPPDPAAWTLHLRCATTRVSLITSPFGRT